MVVGTILSLLGAAGGIGGIFGGKKKKKVTQEALRTPEQEAAQKALLDFGQTGQFGNFQAGQGFQLDPSAFRTTAAEDLGQSRLLELLQSGTPAATSEAQDIVRGIVGGSPEQALERQFDPFKKRTLREGREATDRFKQKSAFGGRLFSSATPKGISDIESRTQESLGIQLANLFGQQQQRGLQGAQLLGNLGAQEQNQQIQQIQASRSLGDLQRALQQEQLNQKFQVFQQQRGEQLKQLDALSRVGGANTQFGVRSVDVPKGNQFDTLLQTALSSFGDILSKRGVRNKTSNIGTATGKLNLLDLPTSRI